MTATLSPLFTTLLLGSTSTACPENSRVTARFVRPGVDRIVLGDIAAEVLFVSAPRTAETADEVNVPGSVMIDVRVGRETYTVRYAKDAFAEIAG